MVLSENPKISNPNANVDIASGTLLNFVGLQDPSITLHSLLGKVAGIGAQIVDERTVARDGKVSIYRQKYIAEEQSLRHID